MSDDATTDETEETPPEAELVAPPATPGGGLSGRKIAAIAVAVVLAAAFVVGLIASTRQKDDENKKSSGPVATVDGVKISRASLDSEVNSWTANKDYVKAAAQQGQKMVESNGQPTAAFRRDILTQQIENVLFTREFNRRHLKVTTADEAQLRDQVSGNPALQKYPKRFIDSIIDRAARVSVLERALIRPPTEAEVQQAYNAQYACPSGKDVSHILVKTLAEADAIEAQLASGANFATLAKAKSTDTGSAPNGGALGCLKKGAFVAPFENAAFAATIGKPTAPVQSQFGFHIILVNAHSNASNPPLASVRQQIVQQLEQGASQFNAFADKLFAAAKVTVDSSIGQWAKTQAGYGVTAPKATKPSGGASGTSAGAGSANNASAGPAVVVDGRPHKR